MSNSKKNIFRQALDPVRQSDPHKKSGESTDEPLNHEYIRHRFITHRKNQIIKDYVYLLQRGEKRFPVEEICFKYEIELPRSFVSMMDLRFLEPPNFKKFSNPPDAEKELSHIIGVISNNTNEKVLYLEAVIDKAEDRLYSDLQNKQFKKLLQSAKEMLEFLNGGSKVQKKEAPESDTGAGLNVKDAEIEHLAEEYKTNPRQEYSLQQVLFVMNYRSLHKTMKKAELIRLLQSDPNCPAGMQGDNPGNKHYKRQGRIIDYFDKQTAGTRN